MLKIIWCTYLREPCGSVADFLRNVWDNKWEILITLLLAGTVLFIVALFAALIHYEIVTPDYEKIAAHLDDTTIILKKEDQCFEVLNYNDDPITTPCKCPGKGDYTFKYEGWCYKITKDKDGDRVVTRVGCL